MTKNKKSPSGTSKKEELLQAEKQMKQQLLDELEEKKSQLLDIIKNALIIGGITAAGYYLTTKLVGDSKDKKKRIACVDENEHEHIEEDGVVTEATTSIFSELAKMIFPSLIKMAGNEIIHQLEKRQHD